MTQTPTPDNDIEKTLYNYGLTMGHGAELEGAITFDQAKAALTRNRDIYTIKQQITSLEHLKRRLAEPVDISLFGYLPPNPEKTQELHKLARANVKVIIDEELAKLTAQLAALGRV